MPFVLTQGQLQSVNRPMGPAPIPVGPSVSLADGVVQDYAAIWRTQPQIRTVVSFLARNIAQLGLHVYRRVSDVDRERLTEHPLAELLSQPNPTTTRYRWVEALISDLALYDNALIAKIRHARQPRALLRLDPRSVTPLGDQPYEPEGYRVQGNQGSRDLRPDDVMHFRGYNPVDIRWGASPIETLRRILIEEYQASRYREQLWRNGARVSGYLQRPLDAPEWSRAEKERFRAQWQSQYTGDGPQTGGTPILEDGMSFHDAAVTPEAAQYIEARKLTREEVASAYHIPPPMIGVLDHATYSNIQEQHKHLYQDTLGPWLEMISQEIHLQLLPDFPDTDRVYTEFNLAEKLRGSFEEQADQLQTSVGAPWMTRNEARARVNLPQLPDGDGLITPLNVLIGGTAQSETEADTGGVTGAEPDEEPAEDDDAMPASASRRAAVKLVGALTKARPDESYVDQLEHAFAEHFDRQSRVVLSALGGTRKTWLRKAKVEDVFDTERWSNELAADLFRLDLLISAAAGRATLAAIGRDPNAFDEERTHAWHAVAARSIATAVTLVTASHIADALTDDDPQAAVKTLFAGYNTDRARQLAVTQTTDISGFATSEAARQTGQKAQKTWIVTSGNPRPEHAAINGETVDMDAAFSNGAKWPGDSVLDDDQRAGCQCDMDIELL